MTDNKEIPRKYVKKFKSGRWEWMTKQFNDTGKAYIFGIRRKSTKEEIYFNREYLILEATK